MVHSALFRWHDWAHLEKTIQRGRTVVSRMSQLTCLPQCHLPREHCCEYLCHKARKRPPDFSGTSFPRDIPGTEHLHISPLQVPHYLLEV